MNRVGVECVINKKGLLQETPSFVPHFPLLASQELSRAKVVLDSPSCEHWGPLKGVLARTCIGIFGVGFLNSTINIGGWVILWGRAVLGILGC